MLSHIALSYFSVIQEIPHIHLPSGERATNLQRAIAYFEAALQVRTREAFPVKGARTQNNLGTAYSDLPGGDRHANLEQAIAYFEAALQTFSLTRVDDYAEEVSRNLEAAKEKLQQLEAD